MTFRELVGKDLWVRAWTSEFGRYYYIRIHDILPTGEMLYNRIYADLVDGYWEICDSDIYNIERMIAHPTWDCNLKRSYSDASDWEIVTPLELLSTEELLDILHSYPVYMDEALYGED